MLYSYSNPSTSLEQFGNAFCQPISSYGGLESTAMRDHSGILDGCCCLFGLVECLDFQYFLDVNFRGIYYHAPHQQLLVLLAVLCCVIGLKLANSLAISHRYTPINFAVIRELLTSIICHIFHIFLQSIYCSSSSCNNIMQTTHSSNKFAWCFQVIIHWLQEYPKSGFKSSKNWLNNIVERGMTEFQ